MPNITLSRERIENAANVIIQFLKDAGYSGSLEDGTGLNDIVVKPSSVIRELIAQIADRATAYQSLQKAYEMRETIGEEEFSSAVDCILSNWFVTRNEGKPSKGSVRLWFLKPLDFMHVKDGESMGSVGSAALVADGEQVFTQSSFSCIINTTENENEYYVDVSVRTVQFSTIAPSDISGDSVLLQYQDIYFLRTTIPGEFTPGVLVEGTDNFIRRTEWAITTRELITARAINTVLLDTFPDIIRLYVARHGSKEQLRDIIYYEGIKVHYGNKADIYIASSPSIQKLEVLADENGFIDPLQLPAGTSVINFIQACSPDDEPLELCVKCDKKAWTSRGYRPESCSLIFVKGTQITDEPIFLFFPEENII